ncbi:retropepsin-like aspartic protease family protein [Acidimangrovimonas pyrenivorans]|uniref:TIGR02281 family clan AA aspartic protease n=1 Tax=Acidimangrovimonas pyrenivorans TaxID=2030798 RepID=A0ABV7AB86_9RHOB
MDTDILVRITYLGLIAAAVGGALILQNRHQLGRLAQSAAVWALIFVGVLAGYGLWSDISRQVLPRQEIVAQTGQVILPRAPDGHFYVTLTVSGTPVHFVVDTGASNLVLTKADARKIGIDTANLIYTGTAQTANGKVETAHVRLRDVRLGKVTLRGVDASVNAGQLDTSLLGMTVLQRFSKIEIAGDRMILTP